MIRIEPSIRQNAATRWLLVILALAFVVSVVHYVDNYVNYADYPQPEPGSLPAPSATSIALSWFAFTAAGLAGLALWLNGRRALAAIALVGYSFSGLVGIGHYLVPGATDMPMWRQAHVIIDIACGITLFGFAVHAMASAPRRSES